jgi:hypothetical protein
VIDFAPIILFVYNRPWHTKQTVEALQKNSLAVSSELFIYSDAAKNESAKKDVDEVRGYIKAITGFKKITIIEREKNWGLADSIIDGVTDVLNRFGKIIVLEDDLVTSPYFLSYMNDGLSLYENDKSVASIHGYIYPIDKLPKTFFIKGADCWGWATWKRAWDVFEPNGTVLLKKLMSRGLKYEADFNGSYHYTKMLEEQIIGKNNSWAIRWYMSAFLENMLTLYPGKSYVENIGNDGSGTHCSQSSFFSQEVDHLYEKLTKINLEENIVAKQKMQCFFNSTSPNCLRRLLNKLKRVFN